MTTHEHHDHEEEGHGHSHGAEYTGKHMYLADLVWKWGASGQQSQPAADTFSRICPA